MAFNDPDGAGVGGWLAFFVLVMAAFTPLTMVVTTATTLYGDAAMPLAYADHWAALQIFEWSLAAAVIAGCWFIAWRLVKVQAWRTVRVTIAGIWIIALGSLLAEFLGVALIAGLPLTLLAADLGRELVRPLVFCTVWTAYFLRSKRVANTYPRHPEADEVAEVFG